jgi:hypothetical protein
VHLTTSPHQTIPLGSIHERRVTARNGIIVVPSHICRIRDGRIDLEDMHKGVSILWVNCADLIRVRSRIPDAIQQFVCIVFVSSTLSKSVELNSPSQWKYPV